jgi:hypothetical protein
VTKTIEALQAGSATTKWVVLIEGLPGFVGSDASQDAIDDLMSGTDWDGCTRVECFVDLSNESKLELWSPWTSSGRCTVRIHDPSDGFATFINRRLAGAQTELTSTADRNDTTIPCKSTDSFPSDGTAYIGTETITYSGVTSGVGTSSFTGVVRGIASPFACDSTGSGGDRFGNHHRMGVDSIHTAAAPLVTQLPRVHIGRRVGVYLHLVAPDGSLNSKADAQLVFAGRIASIADDPQTFATVLDLEHLYETDLKNVSLGRDLFAAQIPDGLQLMEGRRFEFKDAKFSSASTVVTALTANPLVVVSGAPANVNEIEEGYYSAGELCDKLSAWLGGETDNGRIYGHYRWASPASSNVGLRTKCYWTINHGSNILVSWGMSMPGEVAAFLGMTDQAGSLRGQQVDVHSKIKEPRANTQHLDQGDGVPYSSMMFYPSGPGSHAQDFGSAITYATENHTGNFQDQFDLMPYAVKGALDSSLDWGIFLFDERVLIVGALDESDPTAPILKNCYIAPFQFAEKKAHDALPYIGRRLDEPDSGAVVVRQVLVLEQNWAQLLLRIAYSTGTSGYNHSTYDTLPYGCGWNIPGSLLGPEFERSLLNLPGADMPAVVVIDEATTFSDLFRDDFIFRWAFIRWRDQGFEIGEWKTPVASMAAKSYAGVTLALVEANKADASPEADHRIASIESDEHIRPVVRIDYARDFGSDRTSKYTKSVQVEDQRAVDDAGGNVKPTTIKLRHTFSELAATGSAVDKLLPGFVSRMPLASKAARKIVRTIDLRYWEGYAVGDIALVTDSYARDPLTGTRSIAARPAMITRLTYSPGGPVASGGKPRDMFGEVELMFLDVQRGKNYAPCAEVDDGETNAGYDALGPTLTCYEHKYSHDLAALGLRRGGTTTDTEDGDASYFPAGSKIHIIEMDPANPASPTKWERTVLSQTGNTITLTAALSAPAWDSSLKYRIVPQLYSVVAASDAPMEVAFQADDDDCMVEDEFPPWDFSQGGKGLSFTSVDGTEPAEFIPEVAYGDGRPYDPGNDHALAFTLNAWHDYKSAHQSPFLIGPNMIAGTLGSAEWELLFIRPVFLGTDLPTSTIQRVMTVAPRFASESGASVSVRVAIGRAMPTEVPGTVTGYGTGFQNPAFPSEHARTASWTTSSTTEQTGADKTLEINCKDIHYGYVYLIVEVLGDALCRGLAKCKEGPRVVG